MRVISLGWGVQSFTLAVMSALNDLPQVDCAIHADTRHESEKTYDFARRWETWLANRGVRVVTLQADSSDIPDETGSVFIPAFTVNQRGKQGKLLRQCTHRWKIMPIRRWLQQNRQSAIVEQWMGISLDEFQRMRDSDVNYCRNVYPLIEKRMTRQHCEDYLAKNGIEVPPKSACVFCPFHNTAEWRRIAQSPADWRSAIEMDEKLRSARPNYSLFVHPSCMPLATVDLRTAEEKGQISMWDSECSGVCGV